MLHDFNHLNNIVSKYDTCVVGSGPAGITLALKLAASGDKVLLLEAGELSYSEQSQELYDCESVGHDAWPKYTRLRYFGGTSNHWSGRCRPFETADFQKRTINGLPGWPIRYSELKPYLSEAMKILDLDPQEGFTPINKKPTLKDHFYPDAFAQSPPTRFNSKYIAQITASEKIDCFINATAVDLKLNSSHQTVSHIEVANYNGATVSVKAGRFILCLGGIETPRFMLNCNRQVKTGIGNGSDMIGRCFMEHLNVPIGSFLYREPENFSKLQFFTDDEFCQKSRIGRSNITMSIVSSVKSYGRTKAIKTFFKNLACQMKIEEKVQFISDFKCPGMGNISTLVEQAPNLDSRVRLGNGTDSLGLRKAQLDWQISSYDQNTIRQAAVTMAKQFSTAGLGQIKLADFILDPELAIKFGHHAHHMGTTRMSDDPHYGVVDQNSKVHGLDNLYIAGSSVFSTGGACNPTMPIIQLCLRLADHLTA